VTRGERDKLLDAAAVEGVGAEQQRTDPALAERVERLVDVGRVAAYATSIVSPSARAAATACPLGS
jgi:hypothetical protein